MTDMVKQKHVDEWIDVVGSYIKGSDSPREVRSAFANICVHLGSCRGWIEEWEVYEGQSPAMREWFKRNFGEIKREALRIEQT